MRSNRIEVLASTLAERLQADPLPPLATEVVVVQSRGMARWLQLQLADRIGVCAQVDFAFPSRIIRDLVQSTCEANLSPWDPVRLTWSVMATLPDLLGEGPFAPVAGFLEATVSASAPESDLRRVKLAHQLADMLDRVITYRPQLAQEWTEHGASSEDWRAALLATLRQRIGTPHLAEIIPTLAARLAERELASSAGLPIRLSLFGTTSLPPLFLQIFAALGRHRPIDLYVPCPSQEFWGHIRTRREVALALEQAGQDQALPQLTEDELVDALHLDQGHPLLSAFGRQGRDFQLVLEGLPEDLGYLDHPSDLFFDPAAQSGRLLHRVQSDILHLVNRGGSGSDDPPPEDPGAEHAHNQDPSIQVHACHGLVRQVEVLRDVLLGLFEADSTLEPRDVVVLTPDLPATAPLVAAVFGDDLSSSTPGGQGAHQAARIPLRIADQGLDSASAVADAAARLLALAGSRVTASEVLDLLALEPVRRRFDIAEEDLGRITTWVREAGIRWGIDAAHRARLGLPETDQNTWRFGLDRLLLGAALPADGPRTFAELLPHDEVEGRDTELLGRLADFWENLCTALASLQGPQPLDAWQAAIDRSLGQLLQPSADEHARLVKVRDHLASLAEAGRAADFTGAVSLEAVRKLLGDAFSSGRRGSGLVSGAVTLCAMLPLRSIPFRVVCLLGLDDGVFPRVTKQQDFDPVSSAPRVGDPNPRQDDITLFLEAILAARDNLVITHTGRSLRDNSVQPPAVPVGTLIDAIEQAYPGRLTRREHPLQAFSARNFIDPATASFDQRQRAAAQALCGPRHLPPPFLAAPLPDQATDDGPGPCTLSELSAFLASPVAHLFRQRLRVRFPRVAEGLLDREPIQLSHLEQSKIGSHALEWGLAGHEPATCRVGANAAGLLPEGSHGEAAFSRVEQTAGPLRAAAIDHLQGPSRTLSVDLTCGEHRVTGRLEQLQDPGLVAVRYARWNPAHLLRLWIHHLALCAAAPDTTWKSTLLERAPSGIGTLTVTLGPVAAPLDRLADLCALYQEGQCTPLLFFPKTSLAHIQGKAADQTWLAQSNFGGNGEAWEAHHQRVFGVADVTEPGFALPGFPAAPDFDTLAHRVWDPILAVATGVPE